MKWEKVLVKNIAEQIRGVSYKPTDVSDKSADGFTPIFRANNITSDGLNTDDLVYVKSDRVSKKQMLKSGDILIAASSGSKSVVGKAVSITHDAEAAFGAFCKVIRPHAEKINPRYLGHFFQSPGYRRRISELAEGANINNIRNEDIDNLEAPLPPLHIQEQIADTLDKADALRRKDQELLQKYDELAQSIFYDMFGDPVRNEKGWDITHGKDTFVFSSGKFNPTKNLDNSFPYPTYGGNGITGFSKEKLIEYSTIAIGRVGAYCGSVHLTEKESWITDNAIYLKSGFQDFDVTFLLFLFKKLNLNQFADYSGQPKITQKPLEELAYIKPPQVLQKKFSHLVQNINSTKNMLSKSYSEDLNQNLLYRYFS